jgi:hypothetical protein
MKKISLLFACGLFLSLISGCKKDPIVPPDPPAPIDSLKVYSAYLSCDTAVQNSAVIVSWNSNADTVIILVNGEKILTAVVPIGSKSLIVTQKGTNAIDVKFLKNFQLKLRNLSVYVTEVILPPPPPTVSVMASPTHLPLGGGSASLTVSGTSCDSIISPEILEVKGPGVYMVNVLKTTTFHFIGYGPGGIATDSAIVEVITQAQINLGFITAYPCRVVNALRRCTENDPWGNFVPSQAWLDEVNYFYPNLYTETYRYGTLIGSGYYLITADSLYWGYGPYHIDVLNSDTMTITHPIPSGVCPGGSVIMRCTYVFIK